MITEFTTHKIEPDIDVVEISGRLSLGNTLQSLERSVIALIDQGSRKIIVNLSKLNAIDSAGIGTLISCHAKMEAASGQMRIAGAHGVVAKSFDLVHMHRVATLDSDFDTAVQSLKT